MDLQTANLGLPYIAAAQAQKHVTHNEAIRALDAVVQLAVASRVLSTPPTAPADGARYIVTATATGAWAGQTDKIAAFQDGAWEIYAPQPGWIAWISDEAIAVVYDGSAWTALAAGGGGGSGASIFGINATADTTNRLALSSPSSLFNHEGAGHQQKINKATPADTASQLYQTGFSGRAETGLTGDDDFHVKVSPDGTIWYEAIVVDKDTGVVTFPNTTIAGGSQPSVKLVADGSTQIPAAAYTKATLIVDQNNLGDSTIANSRVTIGANDAGRWQVDIAAALSGQTVATRAYKNGTTSEIFFFGGSIGDQMGRIGGSSGILHLAAGDYVELFLYANFTGNQVPVVPFTYLHMFRIGDA